MSVEADLKKLSSLKKDKTCFESVYQSFKKIFKNLNPSGALKYQTVLPLLVVVILTRLSSLLSCTTSFFGFTLFCQ